MSATMDIIPAETWLEFVRMRKSIRKPMTPYAEALMRKRLIDMVENEGQNAKDVLDQSIVNCWQNVYCVKVEVKQQAVSPAQLRVVNSNWWASDAGIINKGRELSMSPRPGETFANFKDRIFAKLNDFNAGKAQGVSHEIR
jgi:hypothetical protein